MVLKALRLESCVSKSCFWPARSLWALNMLAVAMVLGGCSTAINSTAIKQGATRPDSSDVLSQVHETDLSARYPQHERSAGVTSGTEGAQPTTFYGDGSPAYAGAYPRASIGDPDVTGALPPRKADVNAAGQGYELNFENTPIPTVAKTVLGDILGVGYTIDARVQGTVTLSSARPVPKKDILFVLESALRVSSVAIERDGRGYRLIPAAEAAGTGSIDGTELEAGYGITVIPLQYVSAQTLTKLLDNFATKAGTVRADPARNLVVIQGSAADRRAAIDTVLSFDADWMRGQSVGIYPVSNSTPEPIISEVEKIIDTGEGGLSQNMVKLQPIGRQNAILVVARKPDLLKTVSNWITRLDKSGGAGTGVKVYRMRYGDARQVAALLNEIFLGDSGGGLDSPINQLAPGAGVMASSSDRPNVSGSQPSGLQGPGGVQPLGPGGVSQTPTPGSQPGPPSFNQRYADATGARLGANPAPVSYSAPGALGGATPLLPGVRIAADVINNALLIYANQEHYRIIERTLQQIDRPQLQVAIDATIAEITLNDNLSYGVQFFLKSQNLGLPADSGSLLNTTSLTSTVLSRVIPGFNLLAGSEATPQVILNALHQVTDVKVLSTPSLVVVDNQFASLQVGDQVPVTTGSATVLNTNNTVVNTIDYRNTGVILRVAPRVNANGNVLLDIEQEISAVADTPTANTLTPTVSQRKVKSSIAVASGQTVLLAGLISQTQDNSHQGIPALDRIPGLGVLFSNNSGKAQRTELIIFIRPQIIRNGVDARRIAEQLRDKMKGKIGPEALNGPCCRK
jgi:general secretion pathway protein D